MGDRPLSLRADFVLAQAYQFRGDFRKSIAVLEETQPEILGALRHEQLLLNAATTAVQHLVILSRARCMLGEFESARRLAGQAVEIARSVERGFDLGFALQALGMVALLYGNLSGAAKPLEEALRICEGESLDTLFPLVASPLGLALSGLGRKALGRRLLEEAQSVARRTRLVFYDAWAAALLARAAVQGGAPWDVTDIVHQSLKLACSNRYRWVEVWLRHALGVLLAATEPERGLEQIEIAEQQAAELEMLPDVALCYWSSAGILARSRRMTEAIGRRAASRKLFRQLGMTVPAPIGPKTAIGA